ncbi:unnamed protein product [Pleuronectes platessa]|uniref:Uncharacterized protein n=1 Tax=Pleuronectes platessa TaxID=8262 RepID=A0A9N7UA17_PLEPL|nr:unnamed protein product [Pleuronectes platessa]
MRSLGQRDEPAPRHYAAMDAPGQRGDTLSVHGGLLSSLTRDTRSLGRRFKRCGEKYPPWKLRKYTNTASKNTESSDPEWAWTSCILEVSSWRTHYLMTLHL